jgi:hypothetical protein
VNQRPLHLETGAGAFLRPYIFYFDEMLFRLVKRMGKRAETKERRDILQERAGEQDSLLFRNARRLFKGRGTAETAI